MRLYSDIDPKEMRLCICKKCRERYRQYLEEQTPGFRQKDYDICPYCGYENRSSMEYEFYNERIEDDDRD